MKIEINKNELANALAALGKLVYRTSPLEVNHSIRIKGKNGRLTFETSNGEEYISFSMKSSLTEEFTYLTRFEEFRLAVKGRWNKNLLFEMEKDALSIDGNLLTSSTCVFPEAPNAEGKESHSELLPASFVELLGIAAPIINRNECKKVLQGVLLSKDGITVTNGKELLNIPLSFHMEEMVLPFPLPLLATKCQEEGRLITWKEKEETFFKILIGPWHWCGKVLPGIYPKWKEIIPERKNLPGKVSYSESQSKEMIAFLKSIPDEQPHTAIEMVDYPAYFSLLKKSIPEGHDNIAHDLLEDELLKKQDNGLYTITNLGAVLFARRITEFPTVSRKAIRVVQFEGKSKIELLKEYTGQKGYAVGFEGLMEFLKALLPSKEVISGAVRSTKESYPEIALRETIANALIHQDFSISGTGPVVEVYADRIEICNPGAPLVDIERIIDTPPKSRNEKLASMMRRLRMCEELGTGWDKIVATCELIQLPAPRIQVLQENTKAVLFSSVPYKMLSQTDRLYACYCHASIMYLRREPMTNSTLRDRFGIEKKNSAMVSRLLKDAMAKNLIRPVDPEAAPKNQRYVPFWA